jgi:hypothetical protein
MIDGVMARSSRPTLQPNQLTYQTRAIGQAHSSGREQGQCVQVDLGPVQRDDIAALPDRHGLVGKAAPAKRTRGQLGAKCVAKTSSHP